MKYHINAKGEVKVCHAKIKCRFGGDSGQDNHFTSKEAAVKSAQESLVSEFGSASVSVKKSLFSQNRDLLKGTLLNLGLKDKETLVDVSSTDELVEKWFGGNYELYSRIKKTVEGFPELNEPTKKAIVELIKNENKVQLVSFDELSKTPVTDAFGSSNIDIMDDSPNNKINPEDVFSGQLRAFNMN